MVHSGMNLQYEKAKNIHFDLLEVTKMLFEEGNPSGVKEALKYRNICSNELRLPLLKVSEQLAEKIQLETKKIITQYS